MSSASMILGLLLLLQIASRVGAATTTGDLKTGTLYKDPKKPMNMRIKNLMQQMTLEEKIAQMSQVNRLQAEEDPTILRDYLGSLITAPDSPPGGDHRATAEQWVDMVNGYQRWSLSSRLGIPMLYGTDSVHGHNNLYEATIFPHNVGLGATRDPELVKRIGAATAIETRATGIPFAFAPCIAVCRDPRWGRCYESYSEDHKVVEQMTDIILGLQGEIPPNSKKGVPYVGGKEKVVACAKHFVGDGGTVKGIDENNTVTDWHGLLSIHMPGYYHSIIKGVSSVMVSYSSWNGVKMHAHKTLITGFLKGTLKFRGFVISDYQGVDRMTYPSGSNYSTSLQIAINAGLTWLIPMTRIDDAVRRILRVKFSSGLFDNPLSDYSLVDKIRTQEFGKRGCKKITRIVKEWNYANNPTIPLPKNTSKILVAGTHANNLGLQCGGWTISWQGQNGHNLTTGTTILSAISEAVDPSTEIVYSENPDVESLKDNKYSKVKCVVVLISGRPFGGGAVSSVDGRFGGCMAAGS
ncbi:UNVERIFIED_CONTAM: Beta-glucosidase BoGH3B [Sesamum angustifolium]|uniref:Beta-glucosidase BoGH3B n=1 Tax=Sesamum angustifolium TaxID=2727405 RepID=A0AAW2ITF0_9LAMI